MTPKPMVRPAVTIDDTAIRVKLSMMYVLGWLHE
jgi:hypothetical protein